MFSFTVRFTRYSSTTCERQNSAPMFIHAKDWNDANNHAEAVLTGMRAADTTQTYEIASLSHDGLQGGKQMEGFGGIFTNYTERAA